MTTGIKHPNVPLHRPVAAAAAAAAAAATASPCAFLSDTPQDGRLQAVFCKNKIKKLRVALSHERQDANSTAPPWFESNSPPVPAETEQLRSFCSSTTPAEKNESDLSRHRNRGAGFLLLPSRRRRTEQAH